MVDRCKIVRTAVENSLKLGLEIVAKTHLYFVKARRIAANKENLQPTFFAASNSNVVIEKRAHITFCATLIRPLTSPLAGS